MKLQTLTANMNLSSLRVQTLNGREYYVVRMSMLVPGVLPGSKGPLLYPEEEVVSNHESWNGMPIVLDHPTKDGVGRSARHPEIIENQGLGFVFNSTNKRRKLDAEAWIDIEKTQRIAPSVIADIKAGRPVEVSTGLYTDNYRKQGVHNNQSYIGVARNYRPDHLAVLIGKKGACSIKDGCGLLMNTAKTCTCQIQNAEPSFDESEIKRADDGKFGSGSSSAAPKKKGSAALADEAIARGFKKDKKTATKKGGIAGKLADDGTKRLKAKGGGGGSAGAAKVIDALGKANPSLKTLTIQGPEGQYQVPNPSYKPTPASEAKDKKPVNNVLKLKQLLHNFSKNQPRDSRGSFGGGGGGSSGGGKATKKSSIGSVQAASKSGSATDLSTQRDKLKAAIKPEKKS